MALEQKVLTTPTFIGGSLRQAGEIVTVDTDQFKPSEPEAVDDGSNKTPNLVDVGQAAVLVPVEIGAIAPTGPAPTAPQQKPAGTVQGSAGQFIQGGGVLVAEGHPQLAEMQEAAAAANEGVEEEAVQRLNDTNQGAGTAGSGTNGTETGTGGVDGKAFDGDGDGKVGGSKPKAKK